MSSRLPVVLLISVAAPAYADAPPNHTDWATLSQQAIYAPLGMDHTSSRFQDFISQPNHAVGHVPIDNAYQANYQRQPDAQSPAGGVSSSANDMARWMAMVLQGGGYEARRIVASDALRPAITAQIISGPSSAADARPGMYGYGFGVGILRSARMELSHSGAFALGAATNHVLIPSLGIGITVLSNAAPIGAVEALGMDFADLVQFGMITRDWLAAYGKLIAPMNTPSGSLEGKPPPRIPPPPCRCRPISASMRTHISATRWSRGATMRWSFGSVRRGRNTDCATGTATCSPTSRLARTRTLVRSPRSRSA
jgi:hypothetical protein